MWKEFKNELPTTEIGKQIKILFVNPLWATYFMGMYNHDEDLLLEQRLSVYDWKADRYILWDSKGVPTLWYLLPEKPIRDKIVKN